MKKSLLLLLSLAPIALGADTTGLFPAGTKHEEPPMHAPANVSRMFAKDVPRKVGATSVSLPATGDSGMIIWTKDVAMRVRTPRGAVLERNDRGSMERGVRRFVVTADEAAEMGARGGAQEVVHVAQAEPGAYIVDLQLPDDTAGVTIVAAEPESRLVMSTWAAPLSRQPGQPITLHAELRNGDVAIDGATVTARLASPNGRAFASIALVDRGNGVYETTLADLPEVAAGAWQVRFEAEGATSEGVQFARTGSGELFAERGAATLSSLRSDVIGDTLRVTVDANMHLSGNYRLDVFVADGDRNALAWGEGARTLTTGPTTLTMDIPLANAHEGMRLDVRLLGLDTPGVAGRITN